MSEPLSALDTGVLAPESLAVLLDFDGTLVGIADQPDAVVLKERTVETLRRLETVLDGAVAIVSGRSIADIDRIFGPHRFAVAGIHGLERRDSDGKLHSEAYDRAALDEIATALGAFASAEPGVRVERKSGSVALHYRQRPELETRCREAAAAAADQQLGARVLAGKMVAEVKLGGRTKADAVGDFMAEPPFAGRMPLYAGDDVTDEDAFRAVAALDGVSIKIGSEDTAADTAARYFVEETETFLDWLDRLSAGLTDRRAAREGARP